MAITIIRIRENSLYGLIELELGCMMFFNVLDSENTVNF